MHVKHPLLWCPIVSIRAFLHVCECKACERWWCVYGLCTNMWLCASHYAHTHTQCICVNDDQRGWGTMRREEGGGGYDGVVRGAVGQKMSRLWKAQKGGGCFYNTKRTTPFELHRLAPLALTKSDTCTTAQQGDTCTNEEWYLHRTSAAEWYLQPVWGPTHREARRRRCNMCPRPQPSN